jgi:hypothetical protein
MTKMLWLLVRRRIEYYLPKSATTSRAGGMRMAPGRGRGHLCWWPLIFKKNFRYVIRLTSYRYTSNIFVTIFDLCFIGSVGFDDQLTDSSLARILSASVEIGAGCSTGVYQ